MILLALSPCRVPDCWTELLTVKPTTRRRGATEIHSTGLVQTKLLGSPAVFNSPLAMTVRWTPGEQLLQVVMLPLWNCTWMPNERASLRTSFVLAEIWYSYTFLRVAALRFPLLSGYPALSKCATWQTVKSCQVYGCSSKLSAP